MKHDVRQRVELLVWKVRCAVIIFDETALNKPEAFFMEPIFFNGWYSVLRAFLMTIMAYISIVFLQQFPVITFALKFINCFIT
ncbi:MAG: hypothetical protein ACLFSE_11200, partial [Spirochaetia bacterium]